MIKNYIINHSMLLINNLNKYNKEQQEEIKYGLESIYLLITKFIVVFILSIIFNIWKETLLFIFFFNILRATAFGIHASKGIYCWISSILFFLLIPWICKNYTFNILFYIILSIICIISFVIFAPADTVKRPIINKIKRKRFKYITILTSIIYTVLIFIVNNNIIKNTLIFSIILQSILILPITYKIFKLPYNNYKNYKG